MRVHTKKQTNKQDNERTSTDETQKGILGV